MTAEKKDLPPVAKVTEIARTAEARLAVLRDLGYSFSDFDLWDGWLILEESSAERIIRDYLIPWFAPTLTRVRTLSANGVSQVGPTFTDFNRLVRFTHLEDAYRNAAWVRVDGDEEGSKIVKQLQGTYSTWEADRFGCFGQKQFEHYYPTEFAEKIGSVLSVVDKQERRQAKLELLNEVRAWLDGDPNRGREALEKSAAEVIADLRMIERQLHLRGAHPVARPSAEE